MSQAVHNPVSHGFHVGHEVPMLAWVILAAVVAMLLFAIAFSPSADIVLPYVTT
jgi:hypothetical protein